MSFKELLKAELDNQLTGEEFSLIPKGFQKVGDKIIINLPDCLGEKFSLIGEAILAIFPKVKSVFVKTGEIVGELRRPQVRLIAGEDNSRVENFENGTWFVYDLKKIMFAKGNVSERGRLPKLIQEGEVIVDMFVGIGYFSLPISKHSKVKKIYAIDKNPDSIFWLNEGIKKNKLGDKFEVFEGDSREIVSHLVEKGIKADRVLMGYLPPPEDFVSSALGILKKGGIVHYDALIRPDNVKEDLGEVKSLFEKTGRKVEIVNPQRVKSYRPKVDHYVVDLKVY